jgi:hypothetical protein
MEGDENNWLGDYLGDTLPEYVEAFAYYVKTGKKLPIHIQFDERRSAHIIAQSQK